MSDHWEEAAKAFEAYWDAENDDYTTLERGLFIDGYAAAIANQRDHLAAVEGLLREIGAYCEPIAPGLDPVGKALYERIGPLLAVEE